MTFQPVFMYASTGIGVVILGAAFGAIGAAESASWFNPYVIGLAVSSFLALALTAVVRRLPYAPTDRIA